MKQDQRIHETRSEMHETRSENT